MCVLIPSFGSNILRLLPTGAYQGERRRVHEASGPL